MLNTKDMHVQLHSLAAIDIYKIYRIQIGEMISKQNQPHFHSILLLSVGNRTSWYHTSRQYIQRITLIELFSVI